MASGLLLSLAALLLSAQRLPLLTPGLIVLAGGFGCWWLVRRVGGDRFLLGVVLGSYAIRVVVAVGLYIVSVWELPFLRYSQIGGGFWYISWDSPSYHSAAINTVEAWQYGTAFPKAAGPEYFIFTAAAYWLFGPHPLHVILLNPFFDVVSTVVGFISARRIVPAKIATISAALIAFWPSSIIWSSQLMKDPLCVMLTFLAIYLTLRCWFPDLPSLSFRRCVLSESWAWAALATTYLVLHRFRFYVVFFITASTVLVLILLLVRRRDGVRLFTRVTLTLFLALAAIYVGNRLDPEYLFSPLYPERGHVRLGLLHQKGGQYELAMKEYEKALAVDPRYPPALLNTASVFALRGDREGTKEFLQQYADVAPEPQSQEQALSALADLDQSDQNELLVVQPIEVNDKTETSRLRQIVIRAEEGLRGPARPIRQITISNPIRRLDNIRQGFVGSGGYSLIDPEVRFVTFWDVARYLPRALLNTLFAPYPWQWFDSKGSTGVFKGLAGIESVLVFFLAFPFLSGIFGALRSGTVAAIFTFTYVVIAATFIGLTVANLGILFRFRAEFLLPSMIFAGPGLSRIVELCSSEARPSPLKFRICEELLAFVRRRKRPG